MPDRLKKLRAESARVTEKVNGRTFDMTRGDHDDAQTMHSLKLLRRRGFFENFLEELVLQPGGVKYLNYTRPDLLAGTPRARRLMAEYLGVSDPEHVFVPSHESLAIYSAIIERLTRLGLRNAPVKNPVMLFEEQAYDRQINANKEYGVACEHDPMEDDGPDIAHLAERMCDPCVIGYTCVPVYQNPFATVYSQKKVAALARLRMANPDAVIIVDNAYPEHHLVEEPGELPNVWDVFMMLGVPDRLFLLGSLSKVLFPGGSLAAVASSKADLEWYRAGHSRREITPLKPWQLLITQALPNLAAIREHMKGHRAILAPKFRVLHEGLEARLAGKGIAELRMPRGGYFYPVKLSGPYAAEVVRIAGELGVLLTSHLAGYADERVCPNNRLRLAPSCVPLEDMPLIARVIAIAIERAALAA